LKITACSRNKRPRRQTTNFFVFARFGRAAREQKIFSKKEKTQTAGLASATIFIASCVNTRLKRFFFFFFWKIKKKTSSTRTLTCECVFVFTMFTHRVLTQTSSKFTVLFSSATPQWCNKEFFARHLTNGAKKKSWRKLEAA
jgi:hypothetical protein